MSEESIDLGDNPTGTPITQDQGDQILSIIGGQPLRPALTAFGVDGATPVSPTASTLRLDLLPAVGDRYVVLGSGPILSVTMPVDCKDVTLYFEDACNFGPINGWTESGDVIMISQIGEASFVTSHMRYNGTLPVSLTSLGAAAEAGRVLDDTLVSPSSTGTVAQLFSWIGGRLKEITGKSSWLTAPAISLEAAASAIEGKQATLVSGTNIKTVRGASLLGPGEAFPVTYSVLTNAAKLALTGLIAGDRAIITGEGDRLEEYLGGDIDDDESWLVLRNTIHVTVFYAPTSTIYDSATVNGVPVTAGDTVDVGWCGADRIPISDLTEDTSGDFMGNINLLFTLESTGPNYLFSVLGTSPLRVDLTVEMSFDGGPFLYSIEALLPKESLASRASVTVQISAT